MDNKLTAGNFLQVQLSDYTQATYSLYSISKEWVSWGACNDYPEYLIDIYNRNAIHGAIVKGKAAYVYGKGLTYNKESVKTALDIARIQYGLEHANRYEGWNDVYEKTARYFELFNGWAWQIIWNQNGSKIAEVYCMEFSKLRRSKCGKKVFYCDNWQIDNNGTIQANPNPEKDPSYKSFDIFNPNIRTGTQVMYFRLDVPTTQKYGDLYPVPDYSGCIADVETDIEITSFHFHNLKNGMWAQGLLTMFNGEPDPAEKKKIAKMFEYTHSGTKRTGKIIFSFLNKGDTPHEYTNISASDLDKMFEQLSKRLQQNIFTSHRADPVLFGVATEGSLSDTGGEGVLKKWDKFQRTYVENRQQIILKEVRGIFEINGVNGSCIEVEQTTPVGIELPTDPNILNLFDTETLRNYYSKKYGIEVKESVSDTVTVDSLPVNENIANMTGIQRRKLESIINQYKKGKMEYEMAEYLIKGFGLGDDYVKLALGEKKQFSKVDRTSELLALFEKHAHQDNDDLVLFEEEVCGDKGSLKLELRTHKFNELEVNPELLQAAVLDALSGNPSASQEDLAKQLGVNPILIITAIAALVAGGYMIEAQGGYQPTEKAIKRDIEQIETEVYTVYKYVTRPNVPEAESSREFCKKMLKMSNEGKRWTRDAIDDITNEFGEDAWVYRGGFYTNPDTNVTTPFCRHIWQGIVKSRTKKKK